MKTEETNKVIAEFMEHKPTFEVYIDDVLTTLERPIKNYNSDWNWLMEVVEKIESLHESNNVLIGTNITYVQIHNKVSNEQETFKGVSNIKIEAVYNAVVVFIEWYNKNAVKS